MSAFAPYAVRFSEECRWETVVTAASAEQAAEQALDRFWQSRVEMEDFDGFAEIEPLPLRFEDTLPRSGWTGGAL